VRVPVPLRATLSFAAAGAAGSVRVVEIGPDGRARAASTVGVPAGSGAEFTLGAGAAAVQLTPVGRAGTVAAAVVLQAQDAAGPMVSVLPVRPALTGPGVRPTVVADPRVGLND